MYSSQCTSVVNPCHLHINTSCGQKPTEASVSTDCWSMWQSRGRAWGGIRCPSHRMTSRHFRKGKQRKGIMGKQILTNSFGENFRFHYRKSTLFNREKCENLIWQFSVTKNWKSSLEAFVIFLFWWEPLKKKQKERPYQQGSHFQLLLLLLSLLAGHHGRISAGPRGRVAR